MLNTKDTEFWKFEPVAYVHVNEQWDGCVKIHCPSINSHTLIFCLDGQCISDCSYSSFYRSSCEKFNNIHIQALKPESQKSRWCPLINYLTGYLANLDPDPNGSSFQNHVILHMEKSIQRLTLPGSSAVVQSQSPVCRSWSRRWPHLLWNDNASSGNSQWECPSCPDQLTERQRLCSMKQFRVLSFLLRVETETVNRAEQQINTSMFKICTVRVSGCSRDKHTEVLHYSLLDWLTSTVICQDRPDQEGHLKTEKTFSSFPLSHSRI